MPSLYHRRVQHSVGQGLFHSALIASDHGRERFHYVYDCGSMGRYAPQRRAAISRFRESLGGDDLDALFVSHAHADHLNGVPELLDGLRVRTIVMPLLTAPERLMAWARSYTADAAVRSDAAYAAWIADPVAAAAAYGPERIVAVAPGGGPVDDDPPGGPNWSGEPPVVELPPAGLGDELSVVDRPSPGLPAWDLVGVGSVNGGRIEGDTAVYEIPDTLGIRPHVGATEVPWILAMHVAPEVHSAAERFLAAFANVLGCPLDWLSAWLDVTDVRRVIEDEPAALREAYKQVHRDINITSLSVYSGPSRALPPDLVTDARTFRGGEPARWQRFSDRRAGWIGTGDASLRNYSRRGAFLSHYDAFANQVLTMTLPHHGSRHNFSDELLTALAPRFCVAPAAAYGRWNHPHADVVRAVEYAGSTLVNVSADDRSDFVECIRLSSRAVR
jgi:beta-lactamase superfamily II metal-dependent hydrolase